MSTPLQQAAAAAAMYQSSSFPPLGIRIDVPKQELTADKGTTSSTTSGAKRKTYSPVAADSTDENMRSACDGCTYSKIRCVGGRPCARCRKRGTACVFSEKRRCGPKRRDENAAAAAAAAAAGGGSRAAPCKPGDYSTQHVPSTMDATQLNACEKEWLRHFVTGLNAFLPIVNESTLTLSVRPLGAGASEIERQRRHACRAVLWGSVSLGALVSKHESEALRYNQVSSALTLEPLAVVVLTAVAVCWSHGKISFPLVIDA
jgi:Fungal Zn(2)-Cys(6) binuclear cluster domain